MIREIIWPDGIDLDYEAFLRLKDDPVRPHIPKLVRYTKNRHTLYLVDDSPKVMASKRIKAIVCVSLNNVLAKDEEDLYSYSDIEKENTFAHLYTIWSYGKGAGRDLALGAIEYIKSNYPQVKRVLTLSPKTEMARKFHIKNGAIELQENENTINFEYKV